MRTAYLLIAAGVWGLGLVAAFVVGIYVGRGARPPWPQPPSPPRVTRPHRGPRSAWLAGQRPVHGERHDTALLPTTWDGWG